MASRANSGRRKLARVRARAKNLLDVVGKESKATGSILLGDLLSIQVDDFVNMDEDEDEDEDEDVRREELTAYKAFIERGQEQEQLARHINERLVGELAWEDMGPWRHLARKCAWLHVKAIIFVKIIPETNPNKPWCPQCLELLRDDPHNQIHRRAVRVPHSHDVTLKKMLRRLNVVDVFLDNREVAMFHLYPHCAWDSSKPQLRHVRVPLLKGKNISPMARILGVRSVCQQCFQISWEAFAADVSDEFVALFGMRQGRKLFVEGPGLRRENSPGMQEFHVC